VKLALAAVLLFVGGTALTAALASAPVRVEARVALGVLLGVALFEAWLCWFRRARAAVRRRALEAWPEWREEARRDDARRKRLGGHGT
jgi:hypothetical protein